METFWVCGQLQSQDVHSPTVLALLFLLSPLFYPFPLFSLLLFKLSFTNKIILFFILMHMCGVCMSLYESCTYGNPQKSEEASDHLTLMSHTYVNWMWVLGAKPGSGAARALTAKQFLQSLSLLFLIRRDHLLWTLDISL